MPLHLKQTFLPIIWILTEGIGDGFESRQPFKIFSTLDNVFLAQDFYFFLNKTYIFKNKKIFTWFAVHPLIA